MKATITKINNIENLNIVSFISYGFELTMVSLELQNKLKIGSEVLLNTKPTSVSILKASKDDFYLSFENQLSMKIKKIEFGVILTSLQLDNEAFTLESIITTNIARKMQLTEGDCVIALINASDIAIMEVL